MDPTAVWIAAATVITAIVAGAGLVLTAMGLKLTALQGQVNELQKLVEKHERHIDACERERETLSKERTELLIRLSEAEHSRRDAEQAIANLRALEASRKNNP